MTTPASPSPYVSRGGLKLAHALQELDIDVSGLVAADFGASVGGFTDCLLRHGARLVHAVDTAYGTLAYALRTDERVVVHERTNALHATPPPGGVDLVVIDLGWTPQRHALPAALAWLRPGGRIVTLVKPHYELDEGERRAKLRGGSLSPAEAAAVLARVLAAMPALGVRPVGHVRSPITGAKSARRGAGNVEYLVLAVRETDAS